jgi:hypothetical protein
MLLINLFAALVQLVQTALTLYQILHPQPVRSSWFGSILVSGMLCSVVDSDYTHRGSYPIQADAVEHIVV